MEIAGGRSRSLVVKPAPPVATLIFFWSPRTPVPVPADLLLDVAVLPEELARRRVEERLAHVEALLEERPDPVRQAVATPLERQDDQLGPAPRAEGAAAPRGEPGLGLGRSEPGATSTSIPS